ncbi:PorT family protein [Dyadobacter sp. CY343]|uniref:PorT family protein n=1 Tax=Dyadobacter sp. CY343 TaxID=2907299 RepID=UPI001F4278D4|nr:PorT family protein [Dyadobacter sp. CY343]MCE7063121.1 PorT family protein [Dyadobacter sp. CY343]
MADNTRISYSSRAIGKLFDQFYEKCASTKPVTSYKSESPVGQFGIVAGLSATKLDFEGNYDPKVPDANFPMSYNAAGGLFFNLLIPRLKERVSIYNELAFTSYKTSESYQTDYSGNSFIRVTNSLGFGYIKLTNMVRYYIPAGNLKVFLNAGISNAVTVSETNEQKTESKFSTPEPVVTKKLVLGSTRSYEFGLAAGLGAVYKRFGAELRYESSDGISDFSNLKSSVKRYYFLLSYRLK